MYYYMVVLLTIPLLLYNNSAAAAPTEHDYNMIQQWIIPSIVRRLANLHNIDQANENDYEEDPEPIQMSKKLGSHKYPEYILPKGLNFRQVRSGDKVREVVLPWEMKYFSPMLRGK